MTRASLETLSALAPTPHGKCKTNSVCRYPSQRGVLQRPHLSLSCTTMKPFGACLALVFFFNFIFIVVQVQLSPFSLHHSLLPQPSTFPTLDPTPFGFVHVSFIDVPENPSPFPHIIPSHLPSAWCFCMTLIRQAQGHDGRWGYGDTAPSYNPLIPWARRSPWRAEGLSCAGVKITHLALVLQQPSIWSC